MVRHYSISIPPDNSPESDRLRLELPVQRQIICAIFGETSPLFESLPHFDVKSRATFSALWT